MGQAPSEPLADKDGAALLAERGLRAADLASLLAADASAHRIRSLALERNDLEELPVRAVEALGSDALQALWVDDNRLSELPPELGRLAALERLFAAGNALVRVPADLGALTNLRALSLARNGLAELPAELGNCRHLEQLWLSRNRLKSLPEALGGLARLRTLWLDGNQLAGLPASAGGWAALEILQLGDNPALQELPTGLGGCGALRRLDVSACPALRVPPAEVVEQGVGAIVAYLQRRAEQGLTRLWCARWIFVGFERVGKTSLARALRGEAFDAAEQSTDGLGVSTLRLGAEELRDWLRGEGGGEGAAPPAPHPSLPEGDEALEVGLWDMAGQSVYYLTHSLFLSPRAVYVLPWRCDRSPPPAALTGTDDHGRSWSARGAGERTHADTAQLDHWLACLRAQAPQAAVVVVGTHAETDDRGGPTLSLAERAALAAPDEPAARALAGRHPGLDLHFLLADSATGFGLPQVRQTLARLTLQGPGPKLPISVPSEWSGFRVRCAEEAARRLEAAEPPLVPWDELEARCASGCPRLREAARFWHALGAMLHFGPEADPESLHAPGCISLSTAKELDDFVVLRPQWLANLLRCIVTQTGATEEVRRHAGVVSTDWLRDRFREAGLRREVELRSALAILERLELALPWPKVRDVGQYLFPAMLPEAAAPPAPACAGAAEGARSVVLQLPAGLRPAGLFPRMVLRALRLGAARPLEGALAAQSAGLSTEDGQVGMALRQVERQGATALELRMQPMEGDLAGYEATRRRDDALRRALAEALALIGSSFPGLLPATGRELADRGAELLRLDCPRCAEGPGFALAAIEDAYRGELAAPACPCCGVLADPRELLGQPTQFSATRFRPLLRGSAISRGLAALLEVGSSEATAW